MLKTFGIVVGADQTFDLFGVDLAVMVRQRQDFVPGELDRAGFVDRHVPGLRRHDAFVGRQHGVDDQLVGLRAAGKQRDLRLRTFTGRTDLLLRRLCERVHAVACRLDHVGPAERFEYLRCHAFIIIAFERVPHRVSSRKLLSFLCRLLQTPGPVSR